MFFSDAIFSDCKKYRYALFRIWDKERGKIAFIGLNPSTADEIKNDSTVSTCIRHAKSWGFGGMIMLNIFAYRATDPKKMKSADNPIGTKNDQAIKKYTGLREVSKVICAWGNDGAYLNRGREVCEAIIERRVVTYAFKVNQSGEPHHPLYLPKDIVPVIYKGNH